MSSAASFTKHAKGLKSLNTWAHTQVWVPADRILWHKSMLYFAKKDYSYNIRAILRLQATIVYFAYTPTSSYFLQSFRIGQQVNMLSLMSLGQSTKKKLQCHMRSAKHRPSCVYACKRMRKKFGLFC